jgi:uncharacterized protein YkwD
MQTSKNALLFLLTVFSIQLNAQHYPGFSAKTVAQLNTAAKTTYLNNDEKEVVLLMNLARHNGKVFWDSIAEPYIKVEGLSESSYTRSLKVDLEKTIDLQPLYPNEQLYEVAKKHALASGKQGSLGHDSSAGTFKSRMHPLRTNFRIVSENCDYGSNKAIDILMNLLIDEDIPDVGHRENILDGRMNSVGNSIQQHRNYKFTNVQVFGQKAE